MAPNPPNLATDPGGTASPSLRWLRLPVTQGACAIAPLLGLSFQTYLARQVAVLFLFQTLYPKSSHSCCENAATGDPGAPFFQHCVLFPPLATGLDFMDPQTALDKGKSSGQLDGSGGESAWASAVDALTMWNPDCMQTNYAKPSCSLTCIQDINRVAQDRNARPKHKTPKPEQKLNLARSVPITPPPERIQACSTCWKPTSQNWQPRCFQTPHLGLGGSSQGQK